ncbi:DNA polymerase III, alpha subunit (gram-positive type), partial [Thiovulum sp. ES]
MLVQKGEKRDNALLLFKLFIEDSILVAHDVKNDIDVLRKEFRRLEQTVPNRTLCTLQISKNSFLIKRHNLESVAKFLNIDTTTIHRGLADAKIAYEIFRRGISLLPKNLKTVQ